MSTVDPLLSLFHSLAADPIIAAILWLTLISVVLSIFPSIGRVLMLLLALIGELFLLLGRLALRGLGLRRTDTTGTDRDLAQEPTEVHRPGDSSGTSGAASDRPQAPSKKQRQAGDDAEQRIQRKLSELKGALINGYIKSENIFFAGHNFEIDFLVFVPQVGLVVVEVKNWSGDIYASSDAVWRQVRRSGKSSEIKNPSLQVLRTAALVRELLRHYRIDQWPIHPLVLMANTQAAIHSANNMPQTDVIKEDEFTSWINSRPKEDHIRFARTDHERIHGAIKENQQPYPWAA